MITDAISEIQRLTTENEQLQRYNSRIEKVYTEIVKMHALYCDGIVDYIEYIIESMPDSVFNQFYDLTKKYDYTPDEIKQIVADIRHWEWKTDLICSEIESYQKLSYNMFPDPSPEVTQLSDYFVRSAKELRERIKSSFSIFCGKVKEEEIEQIREELRSKYLDFIRKHYDKGRNN